MFACLPFSYFRYPIQPAPKTSARRQFSGRETAGLCKIRASSTLATDLFCDEVYQIAGLNPSHKIFADSGGQPDLAAHLRCR